MHNSYPRSKSSLSSKLDKQLAAYVATATAASVGLLALSSGAEAKVVYTATYAKLGPGFLLDLNHDGIADASIGYRAECVSGYSARSSVCSLSSQFGASGVVGNGLSFFGRVTALRAGDKIGPGNQFIDYGNVVALNYKRLFSQHEYKSLSWRGSFANGGHGVRDRYIGIRFKIGSEIHYGWARISVSIPNLQTVKFTSLLTGYAYETEPNKGIIAGQKTDTAEDARWNSLPPVPITFGGSLGMLALGADGLTLWRRDEHPTPALN